MGIHTTVYRQTSKRPNMEHTAKNRYIITDGKVYERDDRYYDFFRTYYGASLYDKQETIKFIFDDENECYVMRGHENELVKDLDAKSKTHLIDIIDEIFEVDAIIEIL